MYNKILLVGNLTRDIELRYLPSNTALAKSGIATNRKYRKQDGSSADETCFIDITFFGRTAEVANQYLKKGSKVLIEGRLMFEQWVDNNGQKRSKHSVTVDIMQMLGGRDDNNSSYQDGASQMQKPQNTRENYQSNQSNQMQQQDARMQEEQKVPDIDIDEDDIPF